MSAPDADAWMDGSIFGEEQPCFGCATEHPTGFRLKFRLDGDRILTRFTPGPLHQGPPGIMHGGLVMTLADEVGAWALIGLMQRFGFTTQIDARLRHAVRVGHEVLGVATIEKPGRRLVDVGVQLHQGETLCFHGKLRFALLDEAGAERLLGRPLPEAWKRYGR